MMPALRLLLLPARSACTMRVSVFPSVGNLIVSPGVYIEPSGFSQ